MRNLAIFAVWLVGFLVALGVMLTILAVTVYQHFNTPAALIAGIIVGALATIGGAAIANEADKEI